MCGCVRAPKQIAHKIESPALILYYLAAIQIANCNEVSPRLEGHLQAAGDAQLANGGPDFRPPAFSELLALRRVFLEEWYYPRPSHHRFCQYRDSGAGARARC
jgi:hypothetical protein